MRIVIKIVLINLAFILASPLAAQDFDAGHEAYERGDYASALRQLSVRPERS